MSKPPKKIFARPAGFESYIVKFYRVSGRAWLFSFARDLADKIEDFLRRPAAPRQFVPNVQDFARRHAVFLHCLHLPFVICCHPLRGARLFNF